MSPEGSIHVQRVWKRFRPDYQGSLLRFEIDRMVSRIRRQPLRWEWALRDVTLHAEPGESIGLVGANGSGKSTLLKIIGGVMYPYAGMLDVVGRIGALIEVRAGIQQELSGRENIHLYGRLLGLPRAEVSRRFDRIVEFAEIEKAVDRQVKFYSSGMQMRLGFAVASFLDPAILLVDEVLSVGDARFQQRCLDRMREVIEEGTTVIFVSHDLAAVGSICKRAVWLDRGVIGGEGTVQDILAAYRESVEAAAEKALHEEGPLRVTSLEVHNPQAAVAGTQQPLELRLVVESQEAVDTTLYLGITDGTSDPLFVFQRNFDGQKGDLLPGGLTELRAIIPRLPLPRGRFFLWFGAVRWTLSGPETSVHWHPIREFDVFGPDLDDPPAAVVRRAPVHVDMHWEVNALDRDRHDAAMSETRPGGS